MRRLKWVTLLLCGLVVPFLSNAAAAQPVKVQIVGGSVQLQVATAPPGQTPPPATDASTTLRYSERTDNTHKIVVSSAPGEQDYELRVSAKNPGSGMSQGEIRLIKGASPVDLLTQIDVCDATGAGPPGRGGPPCRDEATLEYRALVGPADGPGTDSHTVEYTMLAQ